jgi:microcystin degradation protein MlrC
MTSRRQQVFSPHCFTEHGIDPTRGTSSCQEHAALHGRLRTHRGSVVRCDGPGSATLDMRMIPYRRIRRPMFGLDPVEAISVQPLL